MHPSEIREQILAEYRRVLSLLDATGRCAERIAERGGDADELRNHAHALHQLLGELLDEENEILEPELRRIDAWGELRVRQLEKSNDRQRALLAGVREVAEARGVAPRLLASQMLRLVGIIRGDLLHKEQNFLHPDLLRDDLVIVAQSDG